MSTHFEDWWHEQGKTGDPARLSPDAIFNAGMAAAGDVFKVLDALFRTSGEVSVSDPDSDAMCDLIDARNEAYEQITKLWDRDHPS